jgi:tyrosine-protein phosphatase SIW14
MSPKGPKHGAPRAHPGLSFLVFALFALFALFAVTSCSTSAIPNFAQVAPGIYRGGQPSAAGWRHLRALGATNIIKLNTGHEHAPADFIIHPFPITTIQQLVGPVSPQLEAAYARLSSVQGSRFDGSRFNSSTAPLFIHCSKGSNRTGTLIILYRLRHDHWPKPDAIREANQYGWANSLPALKRFIASQ